MEADSSRMGKVTLDNKAELVWLRRVVVGRINFGSGSFAELWMRSKHSSTKVWEERVSSLFYYFPHCNGRVLRFQVYFLTFLILMGEYSYMSDSE